MYSRFKKFVSKDRDPFYTLLGVGTISLAVPFCMHTVFVDRYASYFEKKGENSTLNVEFPVKVPPKILRWFDEVMNDFEFDQFKKKFGSIFVTTKSDITCFGYSFLRFGFKVGIPQNYLCSTKDEVRKLGFLVDGKQVQWDSLDGELLANSLILSERGQKYAYAKCICISDTYESIFDTLVPILLAIVIQQVLKETKHKILSSRNPDRNKVIVYVSITIVYLVLWLVIRNCIGMLYDYNSDQRVISLGKTYMEGAVEYYEKLLQRNRCIRKLSENDRRYKENGEYRRPFRIQIPLYLKKTYMDEVLKREYNEELFMQPPVPRTGH